MKTPDPISEYDKMKAQKDAIVARDRKKIWDEAYAAGVQSERERCSKILSESFHELDGSFPSDYPAIFRKANDKIFDKDTTKEATKVTNIEPPTK